MEVRSPGELQVSRKMKTVPTSACQFYEEEKMDSGERYPPVLSQSEVKIRQMNRNKGYETFT
jgi:hypothetical protein